MNENIAWKLNFKLNSMWKRKGLESCSFILLILDYLEEEK